jgi:hypothetical protein
MNDKIVEFTVGTNIYKLQLKTKQCILLEKKLGQSPLELLMKLEDGKLPQLNDMITIITIGMMVHHNGVNENKVADLLDEFVEEGHSYMELLEVIVSLLAKSGYINQELQ